MRGKTNMKTKEKRKTRKYSKLYCENKKKDGWYKERSRQSQEKQIKEACRGKEKN